jgi:hypothetical protein
MSESLPTPESKKPKKKAQELGTKAGAFGHIVKAMQKHDAAITGLQKKASEVTEKAKAKLADTQPKAITDAQALSIQHQAGSKKDALKRHASKTVDTIGQKAQNLLARGTSSGVKEDLRIAKERIKSAAAKTVEARQTGKLDIGKNLNDFSDGAQEVLEETGKAVTNSVQTAGEAYNDMVHNATEGFMHGALGAAKFMERAMNNLRTKLQDNQEAVVKAVDNTLTTDGVAQNLAKLKNSAGDVIKAAEEKTLDVVASVIEEPALVSTKIAKLKQKVQVTPKAATRKTKSEIKKSIHKRLDRPESDNHSELYHEALKEINTYLKTLKGQPQITQLVELEAVLTKNTKVSPKNRIKYQEIANNALSPKEAAHYQAKVAAQNLEKKAIKTVQTKAKGFGDSVKKASKKKN